MSSNATHHCIHHCIHCDKDFALDEPQPRPRCPHCLRYHGVESVSAASRAPVAAAINPPSHRRWFWLCGVGVLVLGALATAALLVRGKARARRAQHGLIASGAEFQSALRSRGLSTDDIPFPFAAPKDATQRAAAATDADLTARARAIARGLASDLSRLALDPLAQSTTELLSAEALATHLTRARQPPKDSATPAPRAVLSFEASRYLAVVLRAAAVPARLAVVAEVPQGKKPHAHPRTADLFGGVARYVVVVERSDGTPARPGDGALVFDPALALAHPDWVAAPGDRATLVSALDRFALLSDLEVAAHELTLSAWLSRGQSAKAALRRLDRGRALAPAAVGANEVLGLIRAQVLIEVGGTLEAEQTADQVLAARDSAASRLCAARVALAAASTAQAVTHLEEAVRLDSDYFPAIALFAEIEQFGAPEAARRHLQQGLTIAPTYGPLLTLDGKMLLRNGKPEQAVARLQQAAALGTTPDNPLLLYGALRTLGRLDEAQALRKQLLAAATQVHREALGKILDGIDHRQTAIAPAERSR